jgi:ABC-type glycerol-3-phosphate transport system substrate-binding protein
MSFPIRLWLTVCLLLGATACGAPNPGAATGTGSACDPRGITLTTAYNYVGDAPMQAAKKAFEARYPGLTVEAAAAPVRSYDELTQRVVADFAAGRKVHVVQSGNSQLRFYVDTYKPQPIDVSKLRDTYDKRFLSVGTIDGEVYLVPFQVSVPVLYYNMDLMARAGLDPEKPPTTYSELFAAARAVKPVSKANSLYVITEGAGSLPFLITSSAGAASTAKDIGSSFQWGMAAMPILDGGSVSFPAGGNGWLSLADDPCIANYASELIAELYTPEVITEALRANSYIPVDTAAKEALLADPNISESQKWAYRYTGEVTQWGGWRGSSAPEANKLLTTMTQSLANRAPLDTTVSETASKIRAIVPIAAVR